MTAPAPAGDILDRVRSTYEGLGSVAAFLPRRAPLRVLPAPLQPFLDACTGLVEHYPAGRGGVRAWLPAFLPHDPTQALDAITHLDETGTETLLTAVSALGHTFRWDSVPPAPERFRERHVGLPASLEAVWRELSLRLDLPRVGSAWTLHLCNWHSSVIEPGASYRPEQLVPETMDLAVQWLPPPYADQLRYFSLVFVLSEAAGAKALASGIDALAAASRGDHAETAWALDETAAAIDGMREPMARYLRPPYVQPRDWLDVIQPTMPWSVPDDGADLSGPNGFQVGAIQALDAILDVPADTFIGRSASEGRRYFPVHHRRLLEALDDARPVLRPFVERSRSKVLKWRFNECVKALRSWRLVHEVRGVQFLRGSHGEHARVSTGLGVPWRSDDLPGTRTPQSGDGDDPVAFFARTMHERSTETLSTTVASGIQPGAATDQEDTFAFLSADELDQLLAGCEVRQFAPGERLIVRGQRRQPLLLIRDGTAEVVLARSGVFPPRVRPGQVVGELSFVDNREASASVVAVDTVEAWVLSREHLYSVLDQDPELKARFYQSLALLLAGRLRSLS